MNILIKGSVRNYPSNAYAKLLLWNGSNYECKDSAMIEKNSFCISSKIADEQIAFLAFGGRRPIPVFLNEGTFFVFGDYKNMSKMQIMGGKEQKIYNSLLSEFKEYDYQLNRIEEEYLRSENEYNADEIRKSLEEEAKLVHKSKQETVKQFIQRYPGNLASVYCVQTYLAHALSSKELQEYVHIFEKNALQKEPMVQQMKAKLKRYHLSDIGKAAPDFQAISSKDDSVQLSDFKGKYTLIIFWASWHYGSRKENLKLLEIYKRFKDTERPFEILAIGIEKDKAKWMKAILEDKLPWIQISELKAWEGEINQNYDVNTLPSNLLISPEGIIIEKKIEPELIESRITDLKKTPKQD